MKNVLFFLAFLAITAYCYNIFFDHATQPDTYKQRVLSHKAFNIQKDAFVGKQVKLKGTVKNSRYAFLAGYYDLESKDGSLVRIFTDKYPPADNTQLVVIVYVQPILKLSNVRTAQVQVEVPRSSQKFKS